MIFFKQCYRRLCNDFFFIGRHIIYFSNLQIMMFILTAQNMALKGSFVRSLRALRCCTDVKQTDVQRVFFLQLVIYLFLYYWYIRHCTTANKERIFFHIWLHISIMYCHLKQFECKLKLINKVDDIKCMT